MSEDRTAAGTSPTPEAAEQPDDATRAVSPVDLEGDREPARHQEAAPRADAPGQAAARWADAPTTAGGSHPLAAGRQPAAAAPAPGGSAGVGAPTTVLPTAASRPPRPAPPRPDRSSSEHRGPARPQARPPGRRRARLVLQRVDAWSVFLFSLVASICLGVVLLVAVTALYAALSSLGVLGSLNGLLGEVAGSGAEEEVVEPFITVGRVLGATAVLAAVDVVLLTALATLGALLYNLCASLTGGIEVQLGERE